MNKKEVEEMYTAFFEFRNKARKQRLELRGLDSKKVLEVEQQILSGLKKHTASMMQMCREEVSRNAKILSLTESQTRDWRCGSTRPAGPARHETPTLVSGPPGGIPGIGRERTVGYVTFWEYLSTLEQCTNSRVSVSVTPPDGNNSSQATYIEPCRAQGNAEISGSGDAKKWCTVTMEHDFEFLAVDTEKYRFTPEFFINAIVSLSGDGVDFSNKATISVQLKIGNDIRGTQIVYFKSDKEGFVEPVSRSTPTAKSPAAVVTLDAQMSTAVTVACILDVEATGVAHTKLDLDSYDDLYYWAPRLRVEREEKTVRLYENESEHGREVLEEPVLREYVYSPPDLPWPYGGFRFGR